MSLESENSWLAMTDNLACYHRAQLIQDFTQNMANGIYDNRVALNIADAERVFCYGGELLA